MMLQTCTELLHYGLLLFFGTFVSAAFSGISMSRKNILALSGISMFFIAIQIYFYTGFGYEATAKLYPFISHLPLILFFTLGYKRRLLSAAYSVAAAYLCCQISNWIGLLAFSVIPIPLFEYSLQCILLILTGILLIRYMAPSVSTILTKPPKMVLIFSIVPFVYYLFDYGTIVYTDWLYSGNTIVYEFLPFVLSIVYLIFCTVYFHEYELKNEIVRRNQLLEIQTKQSVKEIDLLHSREHELALLRHDIRHHLQNILSDVENGNTEHAISYIEKTIGAVDSTCIRHFCRNELINTVLSFYQGVMDERDICFESDVHADSVFPCSELDFTSILSNGLENAVKAVLPLPTEERLIILSLKTERNKLLLSIKNRYAETPVIIDGKPVTDKKNHGFGTESIHYVSEKLNGNCQFTVKDGFFILRVVL